MRIFDRKQKWGTQLSGDAWVWGVGSSQTGPLPLGKEEGSGDADLFGTRQMPWFDCITFVFPVPAPVTLETDQISASSWHLYGTSHESHIAS